MLYSSQRQLIKVVRPGKTRVEGTQVSRLNDTVLLSIGQMLELP